jgi:hypothetical protein
VNERTREGGWGGEYDAWIERDQAVERVEDGVKIPAAVSSPPKKPLLSQGAAAYSGKQGIHSNRARPAVARHSSVARPRQ